jgi:hypothetical protein
MHPNVPALARQEWKSFSFGHALAAMNALVRIVLNWRVAVQPSDGAALEGEGFGFGPW